MLRRLFVLAVPIVGLLFAASSLLPQDSWADDFSDFIKKAKEKYAEYMAEALDETVVQETKLTSPVGEITTETTIYRKGVKMRLESKSTRLDGEGNAVPYGVDQTVLYDGVDYWAVWGNKPKRKLRSYEAQEYMTGQYLWDMVFEDAQMVGSEKLGERDCYIVRLTGVGDGPSTLVWMDKKDMVIVAAETGADPNQKTRLVNSSFKKVESGWYLPYKTRVLRGETVLSTTEVESREVNKELADGLFDPAQLPGTVPGSGGTQQAVSDQ